MTISYKKLWKLLIDKNMKKKDLIALSGISQSSITKLGHNENVNTEILVKICAALHCDIGDISEIVPDDSSNWCEWVIGYIIEVIQIIIKLVI